MSSNRKAWLLLTSPFEPLWGVLKENFEDEVIILTNKNRAAVEELTAFYGLKIPPHNIYAADGGLSKEERMSSIAERFPHESIVVVEDSLENLKALGEAAPRGISFSGVLASWGYLAPDDTEEAGRLGFQVLTQKELMDRL